jgi:hypothetical protein
LAGFGFGLVFLGVVLVTSVVMGVSGVVWVISVVTDFSALAFEVGISGAVLAFFIRVLRRLRETKKFLHHSNIKHFFTESLFESRMIDGFNYEVQLLRGYLRVDYDNTRTP